MNARTPPSKYPASSAVNPAGNALAVVPSSADLATISRALYVGGVGDLTVVMAGEGNTVVFSNVPAGIVLPIRVSKVLAATTATGIVAIY